MESNLSEEFGNSIDQCIQDCVTCFETCERCLTHCLSLGGKHSEFNHVRSMRECIEVCKVSASLMLMKGNFSFEFCQVCAKVCDACAESCSKVDPDDLMMQRCADTCRQCAESCRSMAH